MFSRATVGASLFAAFTEAYRAPYAPFKGEFAGETSMLHNEDRTITSRLEAVKAPYDKYESLRTAPEQPVRAAAEPEQSSWADYLFAPEAQASRDSEFQQAFKDYQRAKKRTFRNKRLGAINLPLSTEDETLWVGELQMGSKKQKLNVVFDTASDWLSMEGSNCDNCDGDTYNYSKSSKDKKVGSEDSERRYGAVTLVGIEYTDQVCVTSKSCVSNFEYFLVNSQFGLSEPVDGILGLARNQPFYLAEPEFDEEGNEKEPEIVRGPSLMSALVNAKKIEENTFSFYMDSAPGSQSYIDFGTPSDAAMSDPALQDSITLNKDFFYSAFMQGVAFGDPTSAKDSYKFEDVKGQEATIKDNSVYTIFDTGSTAIIFPEYYFQLYLDFLYEFVGDNEYEVDENYVVTKCYDNFPSLYFMFDQKWVEVSADQYVVDVSEGQDGSVCVLKIGQGDQPFVVMGLPLFMDYYTTHRDDENSLGFVPTPTSTKSPLIPGSIPAQKLKHNIEEPEEEPKSYLASWIICFVLLALFSVLIYIVFSQYSDSLSGASLIILYIVFIGGMAAFLLFMVKPALDETFFIRDNRKEWDEDHEDGDHDHDLRRVQARQSRIFDTAVAFALAFFVVVQALKAKASKQ